MLQAQNLRCVRGERQLFSDLGFTLDAGELLYLQGKNGAGKTSLLRMLAGLEPPQHGQVSWQGQAVHAPSRQVGLMFQNPDDQIIFPTVEEELALGLQPRGLSRREALASARAFLAERGLADWGARAVSSLSQGQRQRLCWLALLLAGPGTLLLDEPYASLDLPSQAHLADEIAACGRQVIVSTHVLGPVRDFARVIWLHAGRVQADGPGREVCAAYEAAVACELAQARAGLAPMPCAA